MNAASCGEAGFKIKVIGVFFDITFLTEALRSIAEVEES
jgi:hypothetical protein